MRENVKYEPHFVPTPDFIVFFLFQEL